MQQYMYPMLRDDFQVVETYQVSTHGSRQLHKENEKPGVTQARHGVYSTCFSSMRWGSSCQGSTVQSQPAAKGCRVTRHWQPRALHRPS